MRVLTRTILCFSLLGVVPASAQEVIGPWTLQAVPTAASDVNGTLPADGSISLVNAPLTVTDAFTGTSLVADGWANLNQGDVVQVSFSAPIQNGTGPELVLFDARYDAGAYAVSTDFDAFATELAVPDTVFVDSGESRSFYYMGGGPYPAAVWGAEIDLSSLGVPIGGLVTTIRFRATNTAADPLGLGALVAVTPVELRSFSAE